MATLKPRTSGERQAWTDGYATALRVVEKSGLDHARDMLAFADRVAGVADEIEGTPRALDEGENDEQ